MEPLRALGSGLVDLLFPPRCLTCGDLAPPFCAACRETIRPVEPGARIPVVLAGARSVGYHEGKLRDAVLRLKFSGKTALSAPLGELMAERLSDAAPVWRPDGLVPVPIHWTRAFHRGFNQSELLARALSRCSGVPVYPMLRRVRRTRPQVGLTEGERAGNILGAIAAHPGMSLAGKRLVLVDDVRTTGATLSECARVLREAGAAEVFALTVTYDR